MTDKETMERLKKKAVKKRFMTTKDLKKALKCWDSHFKDKKLEEARIEVYLGEGERMYGVVEIGHRKVLPNLILIVKKWEQDI